MQAEALDNRPRLLTIAVAPEGDVAQEVICAAAREFADLYQGLVASEAFVLVGSPGLLEIRKALRVWGSEHSASIGVLLWTGHAVWARSEIDAINLLTGDPEPEWLEAKTLASVVASARFERWAVVVDSCYAFSVAQLIANALAGEVGRASTGKEPAFVVLACSNSTSEADAGLFTGALVDVLSNAPKEAWWSHRDRFISPESLKRRLTAHLADAWPLLGGPAFDQCFPNPLYVPTSLAEALDEAHFLPKSRGIEAGETGWYFTGRVGALRRIVAWLQDQQSGILVVTGSAGTGKSALLGRIITLSVPEYRQMAAEAGVLEGAATGSLPQPEAIQVAFHARERRLDELLSFLAEQLEVPEATKVTDLYEPIVRRSMSAARIFTLAVDALDEAVAGHGARMVYEILGPLANNGAKILIGTRPGVVDWAELLAHVDRIVDLDQQPQTRQDIYEYALMRLLHLKGSPYSQGPMLEQVAKAVAEASVETSTEQGLQIGSFLVARVLTKTLAVSAPINITDPGWQRQLPADLGEAFEADLRSYGRRLGKSDEQKIRALLEGLAWEEGQGVPRRLMPLLAEATTGLALDDDDVILLLTEVGGHLSELEIEGWACYRLYHQRFREHLRAVTLQRGGFSQPTQVHYNIAHALIRLGVAQPDWSSPDPYLTRSLPRHAYLAGIVERLVDSKGYLEVVDPPAILPVLPYASIGPSGVRARSFRRAAHALSGRTPLERSFALDLAACAAGEKRLSEPNLPKVRWRRGSLAMQLQELTGHTGSITSVVVTPDGTRAVSGSADQTIRIWDLATGTQLGPPLSGHVDWVGAVAVTPDGTRVVSASHDHTIRIWDLATGTQIGQFLTGHTDWVTTVVVAPDGKRVVSGSRDHTVRIWDLATRTQIGEPLIGHTDWVRSVVITPDGNRLVSASDDRTVRIWDLAKGAQIGEPLIGHTDWVSALTVTTDGGRLVSASRDQTIRIWDLATGIQIGPPLTGHTDWISSVSVTPDGTRLVSTCDDQTIRIWDLATGIQIGPPITGHTSYVVSGTVTPDGTRVVSAGDDRTIRVWDLAHKADIGTPLTGHANVVNSVTVTPDGDRVLSASDDRTIRIWDTATGSQIGSALTGHTSWITSVAVTPDGTRVVSGSDDQTIRIWDLYSGTQIGSPLTGHTGWVNSVAVTPDGTRVVSGSDDRTIRIWDLGTCTQVGSSLNGHTDWVRSVVVTPDGTRVVSASRDQTIRVWDLVLGIEIGLPLTGHTDSVSSMVVTPDGTRLVSGSDDCTIRIWDLGTGTQVGSPLTGHTKEITSVAVTPDGTRMISASRDQTILVWDLGSHRELFDARLDMPTALSVCTRGDSILVVVGEASGAVEVLDLDGVW